MLFARCRCPIENLVVVDVSGRRTPPNVARGRPPAELRLERLGEKERDASRPTSVRHQDPAMDPRSHRALGDPQEARRRAHVEPPPVALGRRMTEGPLAGARRLENSLARGSAKSEGGMCVDRTLSRCGHKRLRSDRLGGAVARARGGRGYVVPALQRLVQRLVHPVEHLLERDEHGGHRTARLARVLDRRDRAPAVCAVSRGRVAHEDIDGPKQVDVDRRSHGPPTMGPTGGGESVGNRRYGASHDSMRSRHAMVCFVSPPKRSIPAAPASSANVAGLCGAPQCSSHIRAAR